MEKRKVCICCGEELPIEKFPTNRRMKDGHLGWCFECFKLRGTEDGRRIATPKGKRKKELSEEAKARRKAYIKSWREVNIDRVRGYANEYYHRKKTTEIFKEKRKAYQKAYRQRPDVKPRISAIHAAYYQRNKEQLCAKERERYYAKKHATKMQKQC